MPEILHQSPPSHHQLPPRLQRGLGNVESQFNCMFGVADEGDLWSWSVDELSKVTTAIEQNQRLKKRKLEFEGDCKKLKREKVNTLEPKAQAQAQAGYIHVRARRGQATDSHSLAERARREKIKKKMQFLQDLVPGCNQITNKAAILDQIITYIQRLQTQVQFLSMKLAASTTSLEPNPII